MGQTDTGVPQAAALRMSLVARWPTLGLCLRSRGGEATTRCRKCDRLERLRWSTACPFTPFPVMSPSPLSHIHTFLHIYASAPSPPTHHTTYLTGKSFIAVSTFPKNSTASWPSTYVEGSIRSGMHFITEGLFTFSPRYRKEGMGPVSLYAFKIP